MEIQNSIFNYATLLKQVKGKRVTSNPNISVN